MELLHRVCAGLDVHKETVVACVRSHEGREAVRETRSFGTTVSGLLSLSHWLSEKGCKHVAMEATGVYWKPVWHVLEESFELTLANAADIRNMPGRKTDVKDAEWIAELSAHGLIRASFVPPRPVSELRDLTRTRKQLSREVVQHTQRIQKTLETANIKLDNVITDILGKTGRAILEAIVAGKSDAEELASLRNSRIKASPAELTEALRNTVTNHHRFLLRLHLDQIDSLHRAIATLEKQMEEVLLPFRERAELLTTIPGVSDLTARVLLAEIGYDMERFPTSAHLISWAGLCPRSDESAGKSRDRRIRKTGKWLKATLVQAAFGAIRTKDTYLRAQYYRLRARRGPKKAIIAVAASMLTAAYHMLRNNLPYKELGAQHFDQINRAKSVANLVRRLHTLGMKVTVEPAPLTAVSF